MVNAQYVAVVKQLKSRSVNYIMDFWSFNLNAPFCGDFPRKGGFAGNLHIFMYFASPFLLKLS